MNAVLKSRGLIDEAFLDDPYPAYMALREAAPIHWSDEFYGGAWLLTRYEDVEAMLRDPRFSARRTGGWINGVNDGARTEFQELQRLMARAMLFVDGADHQRLRSVVNAGLRDALTQLQPLVTSSLDALIGGIDLSREFDFVERIARPLPARVIATLMGVREDEQADFIAWSEALAEFIGAPQPSVGQARRAQVGMLAISRYFDRRIEAGGSPNGDLTDRLVASSEDGRIEGSAELLAQCAMLLFAGYETTRHLLANGLHHLLARRNLWGQLQREPQRLTAAVRELVRFESPVQYTARRLTADLVLAGQPCRRGDLVIGLIGAANRDPRRYENPDRIDFSRPPSAMLAFGSGPHVCIGAGMALLECEIVLRGLLRDLPGLRLLQPEPAWCRSPLYRGVSTLPVIATPSAIPLRP